MTDNIAGAMLLILAAVLWNQYRRGTLGQWIRAKFLNQTAG